jgi:hypothetical protein
MRFSKKSIKRLLNAERLRSALPTISSNDTKLIEQQLNGGLPSLYRAPYKAPVFNSDRSYWNRSYGIKLSDVPAAKIVIFGVPKSGNTWLQALVCETLGLTPVHPINDTDLSGVGMTHLPFCSAVAEREDFLHGVCLVRDPRDVLSSFYRYSKTPHFRAAYRDFYYDEWDEFYYEWFLSRIVPAVDFPHHSAKYAQLGVPVLRYERLLANPTTEVIRLLRRWGMTADEEVIADVVRRNDIAELRKTGKKLHIEVPPTHFGPGQAGSFKSEVPSEILADFEVRFGDLLARWGYRISSSIP